jgi:hypothetical protein
MVSVTRRKISAIYSGANPNGSIALTHHYNGESTSRIMDIRLTRCIRQQLLVSVIRRKISAVYSGASLEIQKLDRYEPAGSPLIRRLGYKTQLDTTLVILFPTAVVEATLLHKLEYHRLCDSTLLLVELQVSYIL